jgi:hypothetical protein
MASSTGICDMCGHQVMNRQKAHIVAEGKKRGPNLLMLCPSCHVMFDTNVKPRLHAALSEWGIKKLPESWTKSVYEQSRIRLEQEVERYRKEGKKKPVK